MRGPPPKLAAEGLTSEIGNFLFEVEAAFSKHSVLLRAQQEFVGRVADELRTPLCISVADNGAGVPKVDGLLLLQPFWKGDANTAGAGLGLALVKRVADSHGARVLLGSSQDGGAEICLNFLPPQPARA